jgi:DNA repair protein RecN (Recombination protein N)
MGKVLDAINEIYRIDSTQKDLAENVQSAFSNITDIAGELRSYIERIEYNPSLLIQVEERLDLIANLKRKYGDSIPAVLNYLEKAQEEKETITHAGERIVELQAQEASLYKDLGVRAQALSKNRVTAAEKLEIEVEVELTELSMSGAQFKVDIDSKEKPDGLQSTDGRRLAYDATGIDQIEFLIAPNPGEGLKPLVKIASGGETSRLMLALKNVLARADSVPTLIFDEIDQGIGGRVGTIVGHKLWLLSRHHQVLCVTHLPQLAAFGEQHIQVSKQIRDGRTITIVSDLGYEARINELAYMLGETSDSTMHSARDMLQTASELTDHVHE